MSTPEEDFDHSSFKQCKTYKCTNFTSRSTWCSNCLSVKFGVRISKSNLKDAYGNEAGFGLFATRDFKEGEFIGYYKGELIHKGSASKTNGYVLKYDSTVEVDGKNKYSSFVRFINGAGSKGHINCKFYSNDNTKYKEQLPKHPGKVDKPFPQCWTLEEVKKDSEFIVAYGAGYWNSYYANKRKEQKEEEKKGTGKRYRKPDNPISKPNTRSKTN
jgi:hypothetical protein